MIHEWKRGHINWDSRVNERHGFQIKYSGSTGHVTGELVHTYVFV